MDKIRITSVQTSYTRQEPISTDLFLKDDEITTTKEKIKKKFTSNYAINSKYLPAIESYGEGIFFHFDDDNLYDVYKLLTDNEFDNDTLEGAIKATFENRETSYTKNHALFSPDFARNTPRKRSWTAFLNKIKRDKELEFEEVMR